MRTHRIAVTVSRDSIQVDPDTLTMSQSDEVQWAGTTAHRFSVEFDGDGPFASRVLGYQQATAVQNPRAKGRFKYSIVSEENPGMRIDPVIIVEDPPTGQMP